MTKTIIKALICIISIMHEERQQLIYNQKIIKKMKPKELMVLDIKIKYLDATKRLLEEELKQ